MTETRTRRTAAGLLGSTGVLHLVLAPEYLDEKTYIGILFILGGLTALGFLAMLARSTRGAGSGLQPVGPGGERM